MASPESLLRFFKDASNIGDSHLESVYKWLFQLDEPDLYLGNAWKSQFPSIHLKLAGGR